jgi:hypothetical protein
MIGMRSVKNAFASHIAAMLRAKLTVVVTQRRLIGEC